MRAMAYELFSPEAAENLKIASAILHVLPPES
jgi:hypothetical protein